MRLGLAEEDGEAEVVLVEVGGCWEVGDLEDHFVGGGHGSASEGDGETVDA